ncbi:MAG: CHAT domain-containing protein [Planctomycetes bacterium]|nr:CHAT domain-containing protein [Planctomycetota bacterium]
MDDLLRAAPAARARCARALLAGAPWDVVRRGLFAATLADPARALAAIEAVHAAAGAAGDVATAARTRLLAAQATHRAGCLDDALAAYDAAARALRAAGLATEAASADVARVDALATAGRVPAALALAARLRRTVGRGPPSTVAASLAVNRGNALRLHGDVDAAAAAFDEAAAAAEAAGNGYLAAVARANGGVARVEAGDPAGARDRLAAAAAVFSAKGFHDLARETRANVAWADVHAGRLGDAVRDLDALAREHREAGLARREGLCRTDLADALRQAGDLGSAEREALRAAAAFAAARARAERAEALFVAASAAAGAAPERAQRHLRTARAAARASGRAGLVLRCDVLLADLAVRRGRAPTARALDALARRARALGQPALAADAALVAGTAELSRGHAAAARRRFATVARSAVGRPWLRVAAEGGLAAADAADPARRGAAIARLRRVARFLDAVRARLPGAWLRAQFAAERLDPWLSRVDLLLTRDRPADRREAEALLDALAARRFLGARAPVVAGSRLPRIRARLEAIYDRLARGEGPTRGADSDLSLEAALERRARAWERAAAEAWRREERRAAQGVEARTADPLPSRLPAGAAVVHLWRHERRVRGLVRVGDQVGRGLDLGPVEDLEGLTLSLRIRAHRWAFLRRTDRAATDPRAVERVLGTLADHLLPALDADRWPDEVRVAADPSLPDVPWEMLPCCGGRLGEAYRVLRVPLGAAWARPRRTGEGTVVLGVGEPDLPGVAAELAAIAQAAGGATIVQGAQATRAAVAQALATARVVHVAGHGWDAEQAPPLGGVRVADGWFSAADLPPGGVAADLVVLAACRAGRAAGRAALAWGGLVSGLLSAGARRVLWSIDDVDDSATARLMTLFHTARALGEDDRVAFGRAAAKAAGEAGHAGAVLAFRLSGVVS